MRVERRVSATVIEWLGAAADEGHRLGGKARSLDRLARLGFTIPPGFCITTDAFAAHLATIPGAAADITALPEEAARERLAGAFEATPLGPDLLRSLDEAVGRLVAESPTIDAGEPRLAVRSSAIGEDGSATSYAGLHDTALDVLPNDVDAAIRRCWASLWSRRAIAYRLRHGRPLDGGGMAVVVQALVPADASAVVFTRHPVTGTDEVVVTAVRGLGEMMASGTVTPDTIIVDRWSLDVLDYTPGEDESAVGAVALSELVHQSLEVERQFGCAVDIEAARAGGRWYLLQARPITTR